MSAVLVVGATRGIGQEFVRQYTQAADRVWATYRQAHDAADLSAMGAEPVPLDVTDAAAIALLAQRLETQRLDLVILNAGAYGPRTSGIEPVSLAQFNAVMHTNVWGPMQLICAMAPALAAARGKLVLMSSRMGSSTLMDESTQWLYRASKAAANSVLRAASLTLGAQGVVCMSFHPGWVKTDRDGPDAPLDVPTRVSGMRRVIAAANDSHNGKFLNYTGAQLDW